MSNHVADLRPVTFTIGQMRTMLLFYATRERVSADNLASVRDGISLDLEVEWNRQQREKPE